MIAYLDSSAIVKLLVADEAGADVVSEVRDAADAVFTSRIAEPECRSALAAAHRAGRLSRNELVRAKRDLARVLEQSMVVELARALAEVAGDLAERLGLRALNAVHLASALVVSDGHTILVSWDRELAEGASASGLQVAPALP